MSLYRFFVALSLVLALVLSGGCASTGTDSGASGAGVSANSYASHESHEETFAEWWTRGQQRQQSSTKE